MKVGDYVRTNKGNIARIVKITDLTIICDRIVYPSRNFGFNKQLRKESLERLQVKSNSNIKELIKAGDFIEYETTFDDGSKTKYLEILNDKRLKELKSSSECCKVKSIITKEQFSQMKYRIGE